MIWALSILFAYSGMLVAAPGPTLKVSGVFGGLCFLLWLVAYGLTVILQ